MSGILGCLGSKWGTLMCLGVKRVFGAKRGVWGRKGEFGIYIYIFQ